MRKLKSTILLAGLILAYALPADALTLVKDGKAQSDIVLELPDDSLPLSYAAQELKNWVGCLTGAELSILPERGNAPVQVFLGTPESSKSVAAFAAKHPEEMKKLAGNDGFLIGEDGNALFLCGSCPKGVLNAVYVLLEKNSDIIFVRPREGDKGFGTVYSKTDSFENTLKLYQEIPALRIRRLGGNGNMTGEPLRWSARLRDHVERGWSPETARVGSIFIGRNGPTIRGSIEGLKYPDFFSMRNGKRTQGWYSQLCYSNPKLLEFYRARLEACLRSNPKKTTVYGINHSDNWAVCECPECMKPITLDDGRTIGPDDPAFRSLQFFRFYDKIVRSVEKDFPHFEINPLAYVWSAEPPPIKLSKRIRPVYAPYVKNHKRPIYDPANTPWDRRAAKWLKQHPNFSVFEYYLCSTTPLFYNPVADIAALDLRYYCKNGPIAGMVQDSNINDNDKPCGYNAPDLTSSNIMDISAIEYWVVSRLYWDPFQDTEKLRDEFCRRAYREAAAPMREFYRIIRESWYKDPVPCYWNDEPVMSTRRYIVEKQLGDKLRGILAEALSKAVHPSSHELIRRLSAHFDNLLEKESKLVKKIVLDVPYSAEKPSDDFDFTSGVWKNAAVIPQDQIRVRNRPANPGPNPLEVRFLHNRENLYIALTCGGESEKTMDVFRAQKKEPAPARDVWPSHAIEIFMDAGLRASGGGYYHLAFNPAGLAIYDAIGYNNKYNNPAWTVKTWIGTDSWKAVLTLPLESFGFNINLGNRIGFMIYSGFGNQSWMGGNVHQIAGFQELLLHMN